MFIRLATEGLIRSVDMKLNGTRKLNDTWRSLVEVDEGLYQPKR